MAHENMVSLSKSLGLDYTSHQYGDHDLQSIKVWAFDDRPEQTSGYWVV